MSPSEYKRPFMSHPYDYFQMRQAALMREAEYERLLAQLPGRSKLNIFHQNWFSWLALHLSSLRASLVHKTTLVRP